MGDAEHGGGAGAQRGDLHLVAAARRVLPYLPDEAVIDARVYLVIKPQKNSFVFEVSTDPAIFLYLDPEVTPAKFANTVAHVADEGTHVGLEGGALDARATRITDEMKVAAAHAIADYVSRPQRDHILPNILDKEVTKAVAKAVADAAEKCGCSRNI